MTITLLVAGLEGPIARRVSITLAVTIVLIAGGWSCAGLVRKEPVTAVEAERVVGPSLPTERADCRYLGRTEIRTTLGDPTASAFSWETNPEFQVYLDALRRKAARMGGDTLLYVAPQTAAGGNQGVLRGSVFRCEAKPGGTRPVANPSR